MASLKNRSKRTGTGRSPSPKKVAPSPKSPEKIEKLGAGRATSQCLVGLAACLDPGMSYGDAVAITGLASKSGKPMIWRSAAYGDSDLSPLGGDEPLTAVQEHLDYYARPDMRDDDTPDFEVRVATVLANFEELVGAVAQLDLQWFEGKRLVFAEFVENQDDD